MLIPPLKRKGTRHGVAPRMQAEAGWGDPENGGRLTVKKYHSAKSVFKDSWQHDRIEILLLNPYYDPTHLAPHEGPERTMIGDWVGSVG